MSVYTKVLLSGSTNGRPIKVTATTSPGTLIHTASSLGPEIDEVWLWLVNTSGATVSASVQWGGTTSPDDFACSQYPIDPNSDLVMTIPGLPLSGGLLVRVFAGSANVINVLGYVNRITQ